MCFFSTEPAIFLKILGILFPKRSETHRLAKNTCRHILLPLFYPCITSQYTKTELSMIHYIAKIKMPLIIGNKIGNVLIVIIDVLKVISFYNFY